MVANEQIKSISDYALHPKSYRYKIKRSLRKARYCSKDTIKSDVEKREFDLEERKRYINRLL